MARRQRLPLLEIPGDSTLEVASLSVAETFGLENDPSPVVAAERALRHCWEGLRQYLAIRLDDGRTREGLTALEDAVESRDPFLTGNTSARATLYSIARRSFGNAPPRLAADDPRWWTPHDVPDSYRRKLCGLRSGLSPGSFEVAELAFARRLRLEEIAVVVRRPADQLERTLQDVQVVARRLLGDAPPSMTGTLEGALLEAFALRGVWQRPRRRMPLLSAGDVIAGRYRIDDHLGTGTFADVYRATDLEVPDHVVALKLFHRLAIDAAAREVALRELRLIASVSHPSVVQFKDHGWHADRLFFVMPFYRGETLRDRLARGPLTRVEARTIFVPLARALATMHATGVRHQDIKPENIILARPHVDEQVLPVLIDLGVAVKDAENVLAGTPNYFAPEVAARFGREPDPPPVTGKADVFSLALVLRNALDPSAEEPIVAGAVDAFVRYRARKPPAPPRKRDLRYLATTFERWLALAPDDRPSAEELGRELSRLTRPEERRARAIGVLRWVVPLAVTFAGLLGATAFTLSREAELQRSEAARARLQAEEERSRAKEAQDRAASVGADLAKELETRRSLEKDVARLEEEYRTSSLTRMDLAGRLAQTEGELVHLKKQREDELAELGMTLKQLRADRDGLKAFADSASLGLANERRRTAELDNRVKQLESELDKARKGADETRARMGELEERIAALRSSLGEGFMPPRAVPAEGGNKPAKTPAGQKTPDAAPAAAHPPPAK